MLKSIDMKYVSNRRDVSRMISFKMLIWDDKYSQRIVSCVIYCILRMWYFPRGY
jgi:hypothetical protein